MYVGSTMAARVHTLLFTRSVPNLATQVAVALAASVVAAYAVIALNDPVLTFLPFAAAGLVAIGLTRPALFLGLLLLVRPLVEINGSRLGVLNAAGADQGRSPGRPDRGGRVGGVSRGRPPRGDGGGGGGAGAPRRCACIPCRAPPERGGVRAGLPGPEQQGRGQARRRIRPPGRDA